MRAWSRCFRRLVVLPRRTGSSVVAGRLGGRVRIGLLAPSPSRKAIARSERAPSWGRAPQWRGRGPLPGSSRAGCPRLGRPRVSIISPPRRTPPPGPGASELVTAASRPGRATTPTLPARIRRTERLGCRRELRLPPTSSPERPLLVCSPPDRPDLSESSSRPSRVGEPGAPTVKKLGILNVRDQQGEVAARPQSRRRALPVAATAPSPRPEGLATAVGSCGPPPRTRCS